MFKEDNLNKIILDNHKIIAEPVEEMAEDVTCGCGGNCGCGSSAHGGIQEDTGTIPGYHPFVEMGFGWGMPVDYARIKSGDTVIDLGSGTGYDCFVAREIVGAEGKVIGIDVNEQMLDKSRKNADVAGYNNVEFRLGDIERLPLSDKSAKVILSNFSLNLVPEKGRAFKEAYRALKHHGQICISDIFIMGDLPEGLKLDADMYLGCMAGTISLDECIKMLGENGFEEITIHDIRKVELPDAMLHYYLPPNEAREFREGELGMYSVVISAEKPCCHAGEEGHVCCGNH